MRYTCPPGLRDLDPSQLAAQNWVQSRLLSRFARYGYQRVGVPTLEYRDLYTPSRMGPNLFHELLLARLSQAAEFPSADPGATDPASAEATHDAALRPDFTTPLARRLVEQILDSGVPQGSLRRSYAGSVFRDVSATATQQKEFTQCGVELVGDPSLSADLELLTLACDCAEELGLPTWRLQVGHAGLFKSAVAQLGLAERSQRGLLNNLVLASKLRLSARLDSDALFERALHSRLPAVHRRVAASGMPIAPELCDPIALPIEAWRWRLPELFEGWLRQVWIQERGLRTADLDLVLGLSALDPDPERFFVELAPFLRDQDSAQAASELQLLVQRLQARRSVSLALTPTASRGIGYYTGLTFELHSTQGALCGGGRYGGLHAWILERVRATTQLRTGTLPAIPGDMERMLTGVGLAWGVERVVDTLDSLPGAQRPPITCVRSDSPDLSEATFALADALRATGLCVSQGGPRLGQDVVTLTRAGQDQGTVQLTLAGQPPRTLPQRELAQALEQRT